jgi:hypothetical protein
MGRLLFPDFDCGVPEIARYARSNRFNELTVLYL